MSKPVHLLIRNFAQVEEASLEFGSASTVVGGIRGVVDFQVVDSIELDRSGSGLKAEKV